MAVLKSNLEIVWANMYFVFPSQYILLIRQKLSPVLAKLEKGDFKSCFQMRVWFVTTAPHYAELGKILGSDSLQLEITICCLSQAVVIYMAKKKRK